MKIKRLRLSANLHVLLLPLLTLRRKSGKRSGLAPSDSDLAKTIVQSASSDANDSSRVHAACAAFAQLLFELDEVHNGQKTRISEDLLEYFRPKFLAIATYGLAHVVCSRTELKDRRPDLNSCSEISIS